MSDSKLTNHIAALLKKSDTGAVVEEDAHHPGFYTIDGWFNLDAVAEKIAEFIKKTK